MNDCKSRVIESLLSKKLEAKGAVLPEKLLQANQLDLKTIAYLICRGGWPVAVDMPQEVALSMKEPKHSIH